MNTRLTKEDQAMIKEAKGNKVSGPIYNEDGLRLLKVLGNPEYLEVKNGVRLFAMKHAKDLTIFKMWYCQHQLSTWAQELSQAA